MAAVVLKSVYFGIYAVLASFGVLFSAGGREKTKKAYVFTAFIFLALFTGLRWETGTDWDSYKQLFDNTVADTVFHTYHFDLGYVVFNYLVKLVSPDYTVFLLINSFLAVGLVYYAVVKAETLLAVNVLVFYTNYFIAHYMGSNRRIIALGLGLSAILLVYENKKVKAFIFIMLAFSFHRSALVLLLAYLIPREKTNIKKMSVMLGACAVIGVSGVLPEILRIMLSTAYNATHLYIFNSALFHVTYAQAEGLGIQHFIFACIKRLAFFAVMYFFYRQAKQKNRLYAYLLNVYALAVCLYFLTVDLGTFSILTTYFTIVEIIIWGLVYQAGSRQNRPVIVALITGLCFVQLLNDFPVFSEMYFPYRSVWT